VLTAEITDALHRLTDARGGLGMHHRQDLRLVLLEAGFDLLEAEGFTPGLLDGLNIGPVAASHVLQTQAEIALDRNQNGVARFNDVGDRGFHRRRASAAHRQGQAVVGLPGVAKQLLDFAHEGHIEGVQVADRRAAQGLQNGGMGVGGAGSQQQTLRSVNRSKRQPMPVRHG